ncbi:hypothetical protein EON79_08220 [bacterium]|nr:MAG: hypothetical protein EON79_08220 [bacterium]
MEHFGRWLAQNGEKRVGTNRQVLGIFSTMATALLILFAGAAASDHMTAVAVGLGALSLGSVGGWIPYLKFRKATQHQARYRGDYKRIWTLQWTGKLKDEIGPKGEHLEAGARDWEAVVLLAERSSLLDGLSGQIKAEADARMDRVFDLSFTPPAFYGLSQAGADEQIQKDISWLGQARQAMEDATLTGESLTNLGEDPLIRLRSLASERETALAELKVKA